LINLHLGGILKIVIKPSKLNKRAIIALVFFTFVIGAIFYLPMQELYSTFQFRFMPETAKTAHFIRLKDSSANQIYLLGTAHERHFKSDSTYPYWQLRSVIEQLKPNLLLLEIRPQEFNAGEWGESPAEMSYAAIIGKNTGIKMAGMDYWKPGYQPARDFDDREDHMIELILQKVQTARVSLILTGYSHIPGLTRRLVKKGYEFDNNLPKSEKIKLLNSNKDPNIPPEYFVLSSRAISKIENHQSDFSESWAKGRKQLLDRLKAK
jgi:hypothetical protein